MKLKLFKIKFNEYVYGKTCKMKSFYRDVVKVHNFKKSKKRKTGGKFVGEV